MKSSLRAVLATATLFALALGAPGVANAKTFNESSSGSDYLTTSTTLNYTKAHGTFKLRVWVTKGAGVANGTITDKYSIKMYDSKSRLMWSAGGQRDRTYDVGANVTRVELQREAKTGAQTNWQRR